MRGTSPILWTQQHPGCGKRSTILGIHTRPCRRSVSNRNPIYLNGGYLEQDHLRDVLGVGFQELPPQAPGMDLRAVAVDKRGPGALIARLIAQGHQDAHARAAAGRPGQVSTSLGGDDLLSQMQQILQRWNEMFRKWFYREAMRTAVENRKPRTDAEVATNYPDRPSVPRANSAFRKKSFGSMASESPSFLGTSGETWASIVCKPSP
jgi:hypothetical protein